MAYSTISVIIDIGFTKFTSYSIFSTIVTAALMGIFHNDRLKEY